MFAVGVMFIIGISSIVFFRNWSSNEQVIRNLENKKLQSQIEMTKEQISPPFLSKILRKAAELTECDSQRSSDILLKLSKVLRYQLYDCQREGVLLKSEIDFLSNYLELEKEYAVDFEFRIHYKKEMGVLFISPFQILLPIQNYVRKIRDIDEIPKLLEISFQNEDLGLLLICRSNVAGSFEKQITNLLTNYL